MVLETNNLATPHSSCKFRRQSHMKFQSKLLRLSACVFKSLVLVCLIAIEPFCAFFLMFRSVN